MPKCEICHKAIKPKEPRSYATVLRNGKPIKVYGCANCTEAFDNYLDTTCPECGSEDF